MPSGPEPRATLHQLLQLVVDKGASDLHVTAGAPPLLRIDGQIVPLRAPALTPAESKQLCYSALTEEQRARFERTRELDWSFGVKGLSRFRANAFLQRGSVACVFRAIPLRVPTFEELGLPPIVAELAKRPSGLVLVTGATGSGKSTTLAAIVDKINSEQRVHILTIEDPIEYVHANKLSVVNQREVGADTEGFRSALKYVLRQDPDVVLIGEMRDPETIEAALTLSETGHLVLATLHTNSAVSTIHRIVDAFSPHEQPQVRAKLSFVLQGVITQQLVPRAEPPGRVLAIEIMIPNVAIRNLVREDKVHQIYGLMQVGQDRHGMQTLNQSLAALCARGLITYEEALARSSEPEELRSLVARARA